MGFNTHSNRLVLQYPFIHLVTLHEIKWGTSSKADCLIEKQMHLNFSEQKVLPPGVTSVKASFWTRPKWNKIQNLSLFFPKYYVIRSGLSSGVYKLNLPRASLHSTAFYNVTFSRGYGRQWVSKLWEKHQNIRQNRYNRFSSRTKIGPYLQSIKEVFFNLKLSEELDEVFYICSRCRVLLSVIGPYEKAVQEFCSNCTSHVNLDFLRTQPTTSAEKTSKRKHEKERHTSSKKRRVVPTIPQCNKRVRMYSI